jgi:hypothetical protein
MASKSNGKGNASKTQSRKKAAPTADEPKNLTIIPSYPNPFPSFYANYASVTHSASEFFIDCALMATPYDVNLEARQAMAPVIARIIFPPPVAAGLIKALEAQVEKHKKTVETGTVAISLPKPEAGKKE